MKGIISQYAGRIIKIFTLEKKPRILFAVWGNTISAMFVHRNRYFVYLFGSLSRERSFTASSASGYVVWVAIV